MQSAIWPAVLLLALYLLYVYLFMSCEWRSASSHRSTHSTHSLVGSYQSLQHALLTSTPTQHSSNLSNTHMCVSTSESSLHHSHASPRPHSPSLGGSAAAPAAAPAASAAATAAAEQPGDVTPPRGSGGTGTRSMHMSVTLLAPPRSDGSNSLAQSTPRFGVPAHAAALTAVIPTEASPTALSAPALHALVAARDTLRASFGREDGVQWCPPPASPPLTNTGSPAHDFDGAVGPSTQFIRDEVSAKEVAAGGGSTSSAAKTVRTTVSRGPSRTSRPRSVTSSIASSGGSLSPGDSSGSDVIGLAPPPAAILPGTAAVVPGVLGPVPRAAAPNLARGRPSAAGAHAATAPDAPRSGDGLSAMEGMALAGAGVCALAVDACDSPDSHRAVDTSPAGNAVLARDSASAADVVRAVGGPHAAVGVQRAAHDPRAADGVHAELAPRAADLWSAMEGWRAADDAPLAGHAPRAVDGLPADSPGVRVSHAPRAEDVDAAHADDDLCSEDDPPRAAHSTSADDGIHAGDVLAAAHAQGTNGALHAQVSPQGAEGTPRAAHAPLAVEGLRAAHYVHAAQVRQPADGPPAAGIIAAPEAVAVHHAPDASPATDAPHAASAPRTVDGLRVVHDMRAASASHAAALRLPHSGAADVTHAVAVELPHAAASDDPHPEHADHATGAQSAGDSLPVADLPFATGTPYAAHALHADAAPRAAPAPDREDPRQVDYPHGTDAAHAACSPRTTRGAPHAHDMPRAAHAPHDEDAQHAAAAASRTAAQDFADAAKDCARAADGVAAPHSVATPRAAAAPPDTDAPDAAEARHAVAARPPRAAAIRLPHAIAADNPHAVAAEFLRAAIPTARRDAAGQPAAGALLAEASLPATGGPGLHAVHAPRAQGAPQAMPLSHIPRAVRALHAEQAPVINVSASLRSDDVPRAEDEPHAADAQRAVAIASTRREHAPRADDTDRAVHALRAGTAQPAAEVAHPVTSTHAAQDVERAERAPSTPDDLQATHAVDVPRAVHAQHAADAPYATHPGSAVAAEPTRGAHATRAVGAPAAAEVPAAPHAAGASHAAATPSAVAEDAPSAAGTRRGAPVRLPHNVAADHPHAVAADILRAVTRRVVAPPPAIGPTLSDVATPAISERFPRAADASPAATAQHSEAAPRSVAMRHSEASPRGLAVRHAEAAPHDAHAPRFVALQQDDHSPVVVDARCAVHTLRAVPEHHALDDPRAVRPPRLPAMAAARAVQAPRAMTADLPHAVATGLPRAVASDLPHAAAAYLPRAMFVDLPHAVAADVPHSVTESRSEDAQQTESARRAAEVPLATDGDDIETAPRTEDAPRAEDARGAEDAQRADDARSGDDAAGAECGSTPAMAENAPRAERGPRALAAQRAVESDATRTARGASAANAPPASATPIPPNRAAARGARPVNTSNHTSRRHGGRRRRGRRGHAGRPVAEAVHADEDSALLPVVIPSEPSVFQVTAAHGNQHNSTISVDLSSVRFPSCHTPIDGSSWCGGDLPSTQRESPPTSGPRGCSGARGIVRGALSLLAALPGRAWSCIEYPLATIARCFMPKLDAAESDPRAPLFTSMLPVTIPLFLIVTQKLAFYPGAPLSSATVLYGTACSLFSSILLYTVYPPTGTADADRRVCFAVVALCMARLWMFLLAAETNHVFRALGRIHGGMFDGRPGLALATPAMPPTVAALAAAAAEHGPGVLSATVYDWVEMAPDFVAIVGIASAGLTATAVAGCFGTPIFSMTVGTGVALLREIVRHGPETWQDTPVPWVALAFAAASAARHALLVPLLHRWRLTWAATANMVLFYVVFEAVYIWVSV